MFPCLGFNYGLWWIFPLLMIFMMVFCLFMMRGRMGSMMSGSSCCGTKSQSGGGQDQAAGTAPKKDGDEIQGRKK